MTYEELLKDFELSLSNGSRETQRTYMSSLYTWDFDSIPTADMVQQKVSKFMEAHKATGKPSMNSLSLYKSALIRFYSWGIEAVNNS